MDSIRSIPKVLLAIVMLSPGCGFGTSAPAAPRLQNGGSLSPQAEVPASPVHSADMEARERTSLVDPSAWSVVAGAEDPFADRADAAKCPDDTHKPEMLAGEQVFSVNSGGCRYLTARQAVRRPVSAGEILVLRLWHVTPAADTMPATAHVAVRVGAASLLDTTLAIPSPGGLLRIEQVAAEPVAAGAMVYFHVHNEVDDAWSFIELSAGTPATQR